MAIFAKAIERLVRELSKFPGVGEKTATRLALHILRSSTEDVHSLAESILAVKEKVQLCTICFNMSDSEKCNICKNESRDSRLVCVVEGPQDVAAIERTGEFRGLYHVLHGVLSPLDGIGPEDLKIESLVEKVASGRIEEVIMATNPKVEGETTALYVAKLLKPFGVKVTRLAQGLPMGGELEYFDEATVSKALEGRRVL